MKKLLFYLTLLSLCGCQTISNLGSQSNSFPDECPEVPEVALNLKDLQKIELSNQMITKSGIAKKTKSVGFTFEAKAGQKFSYRTSDDICIWVYMPDNELVRSKTLPITGKYIIQIAVLQGEANFEIEMSLETELKMPDLVGVWKGYYGLNNPDSTLEITRQSGKSFEGQLMTIGKEGFTFILGIEGEVNPKTREITMKEVKYIKKAGFWRLGANRGILSEDFLQMEGTGYDNKWNYEWKFIKQE